MVILLQKGQCSMGFILFISLLTVLFYFLGESGMFRCLVSGEPAPEILWSKGKWNKIKDGGKYKVYKDETTGEDVLEITDIKKKDAGTYLVTVKNEHGTTDAPATLIVTDKPEDVQDWKDMLKHR